MSKSNGGLKASSASFGITGVAFVIIGLTVNRTFLWIGIPFVITAIVGLVISRGDSDDDEPLAKEDHKDDSAN